MTRSEWALLALRLILAGVLIGSVFWLMAEPWDWAVAGLGIMAGLVILLIERKGKR